MSAAEIVIKELTLRAILNVPLGKICPAESFSQYLTKIMKTENGLTRQTLLPVKFVPMLPGLPDDVRNGSREWAPRGIGRGGARVCARALRLCVGR